MVILIICQPIPRRKQINKKGVGTIFVLPFFSGFSHCLGMDKTIATHTKGYVKSQHWLYKPMMWCYCYHLHAFSNFARI